MSESLVEFDHLYLKLYTLECMLNLFDHAVHFDATQKLK